MAGRAEMKLVFQKFLSPTHGDGVFNRVTSTAGVVISNSSDPVDGSLDAEWQKRLKIK